MQDSKDLPFSLTHLNIATMQSYLLGMYHIYNVKHAEQTNLSAMVAHARRGDAEALEQMYRTFAPKMRATCKRVMKREMPAIDDLLHDAFVLAYTSLDQLKEPDRLEMWLCAIARNVTLRYVANLQARGMQRLDDMGEGAVPQAGKSTAADALAMVNELLAVIDRLPHGYRDILRLHVLEGYSHEEIGTLLGIAPHSSSSQLSRAKAALRRMMQERKMWWTVAVALLMTPVVHTYLNRRRSEESHEQMPLEMTGLATRLRREEVPSKHEGSHATTTATPQHHLHCTAHTVDTHDTVPRTLTDTTTLLRPTHETLATTDTLPSNEHPAVTDSTHRPTRTPSRDYAVIDHASSDNQHHDRHNGWHVGGTGLYGTSAQQNAPRTMGRGDDFIDSDIRPTTPEFSNWEDYHKDLVVNNPSPDSKTKALMDIAAHNSGDIVQHEHHLSPITVGITLERQITERWSVSTGLQYTLLRSTFSTGNGGYCIERKQRLHYVGVPLQASWKMWTWPKAALYASGGLTIDIPIRGEASERYVTGYQQMPSGKWHFAAPWQVSPGIAIGFQYRITPAMGIYVEPTLNYHIPNGSDIHSVWTEQPCSFTVPLGIKFTW